MCVWRESGVRGGTDLFNGTFIFLESCKTEFMKQFVRKKTGRITRRLSIIELYVYLYTVQCTVYSVSN